jgi:hypothetical protein
MALVILSIIYFIAKYVALTMYDINTVMFDTSYINIGTIQINKQPITKEVLSFENIRIETPLEELQPFDYGNDDFKYYKVTKDNKDIITFWFGESDSYIEKLKKNKEEIGTKRVIEEVERIINKNNITTDKELLEFLKDKTPKKVNVFTPLSKIKENYTIQYMKGMIFMRTEGVILIEGDYKGYLLGTGYGDKYKQNIYQAQIEYNNKYYYFVFISQEKDIFNIEHINQILNKLEIE